MAPNLLGRHAHLRCNHCLHRVAVQSSLDPNNWPIETPCDACGQLIQAPIASDPSTVAALVPQSGQRVLLRRLRASESPKRWQIVVADTTWAGTEQVKRIVGLPGERLEIRAGDVWNQHGIVPKSLDEFRRLAIPVLDTHPHDVTATGTGQRNASHWHAAWQRWLPTDDPAWQVGPSGTLFLRRNPQDARVGTVDQDEDRGPNDQHAEHRIKAHRLRLRPRALVGRQSGRALVLDDYAYNHALSRPLHPVRDFLLEMHLAEVSPQRVAWQFLIDDVLWRVTWEVSQGRVVLWRNQQAVASSRVRAVPQSGSIGWELAYVDRRILIARDGQVLIDHQDVEGGEGGLQELEFTCTDPLIVERAKLGRDVYYLIQPSHAGPVQLANDEYFLLGDNVPVSLDSRQSGPARRAALRATIPAGDDR